MSIHTDSIWLRLTLCLLSVAFFLPYCEYQWMPTTTIIACMHFSVCAGSRIQTPKTFNMRYYYFSRLKCCFRYNFCKQFSFPCISMRLLLSAIFMQRLPFQGYANGKNIRVSIQVYERLFFKVAFRWVRTQQYFQRNSRKKLLHREYFYILETNIFLTITLKPYFTTFCTPGLKLNYF